MSYQVLARKWRPNNFAELVGQEHVVAAISNGLENNRLHHAYLFTGTRGVGKTTIARILSKSLNCEVQTGANPCGQCSTCQDIEQGRYVDLLEIDAASRTKVEDTRELLDNVQYKPTRGHYKVYLIDEVHMLSKHSFNALLKTLEEPPEHVKFLLATTDPQKLPITILSRCLQFNLKALSRTQIKQQITHILGKENIESDEDALNHLARAAQGSMRDALSLTDQAIASGNGKVSNKTVVAMLGLLDRNQLSKLLASVLAQDSIKTFEWVESLANQSPDYTHLMSELLSLLHQVALTQFVPDACKLETSTPKVIYQLAKTISPEHIQLCYQIVLQGKRDLPYAADGRSGLEMTLLRMLSFTPATQKKTPSNLSEFAEQELLDPPKNESFVDAELLHRDTGDESDLSDSGTCGESVVIQNEDVVSTEHEQLAEQQASIIEQADSFRESEQRPITSLEQKQEIESASISLMGDTNNEDHSDNQQTLSRIPEPKLQQDLSTTASLIAMKQQIKALNKKDSEQRAQELDSETARSFEPPVFAANKNVAAPTATEENIDEGVEEENTKPEIDKTIEENLTNPQSTADDLPPFDMKDIEPDQTNHALVEPEPEPEPEPESEPESVIVTTVEESSDDSNSVAKALSERELTQTHNLDASGCENRFEDDEPIDFGIEDNIEVTLTIRPFNQIGEKVIAASQLDSWSKTIEDMEIRGLTKQLALHSNISHKKGTVSLLIPETKSHLNTDVAKERIKSALERLSGNTVQLLIEFGQPIDTPFAIQRKINKVRHQYACELVNTDENIAKFVQGFDASVEPNTTFAR